MSSDSAQASDPATLDLFSELGSDIEAGRAKRDDPEINGEVARKLAEAHASPSTTTGGPPNSIRPELFPRQPPEGQSLPDGDPERAFASTLGPSHLDQLPESEPIDVGVSRDNLEVEAVVGGETAQHVVEERTGSSADKTSSCNPTLTPPLQDVDQLLPHNDDLPVAGRPPARAAVPATVASELVAMSLKSIAGESDTSGLRADAVNERPIAARDPPTFPLRRGRRAKRPALNLPAIGAPAERPIRFLTVKQVAARYGVGVATIWRWVKEGRGFPKRVHLAPGTTRWRETDLIAFEASRQDHK
jgi:prophage regulatory protein